MINQHYHYYHSKLDPARMTALPINRDLLLAHYSQPAMAMTLTVNKMWDAPDWNVFNNQILQQEKSGLIEKYQADWLQSRMLPLPENINLHGDPGAKISLLTATQALV